MFSLDYNAMLERYNKRGRNKGFIPILPGDSDDEHSLCNDSGLRKRKPQNLHPTLELK